MNENEVGLPTRIIGANEMRLHLESLRPCSDLTYRTIEGVDLDSVNLHRSLLTGAILRNCTFRNVDFSRADLDGMRVESCSFHLCTFEGADIRSTLFYSCTFDDCNIESVFMFDCSFMGCRISSSRLCFTTITQCSFVGGELISSALSRSSCILNRFEKVSFIGMTLGDCTFLYAVMKECKLENSRVNAESIGTIFGLSDTDIEKLEFLYLGEEQIPPSGHKLVDLLIQSYHNRRWSIGIAIMRLNFSLTSTAFAIHEYMDSVVKLVERGGSIKGDEFQFLVDVMGELHKEARLPLMTVIQAIEMAAPLLASLERDPAASGSRNLQTIRRFSGDLFLIVNDMLDEFESQRLPLKGEDEDRAIELIASFEHRPSISLSTLINELVASSGLEASSSSVTLRTKQGSFVEVVSTTLFSVLALQIFVFLLNGCIIQVTELKARLQVLARKRPPSDYAKSALRPRQDMPKFLAKPIRNLLNYASNLLWLPDYHLNGFSAENIKSIDIEAREPSKQGS